MSGTSEPQSVSNSGTADNSPGRSEAQVAPDKIEVDGEWFLVWADARMPESCESEADADQRIKTLQALSNMGDIPRETA